MASTNTLEDNINSLKKYITSFPDFPKPGIIYKDILFVLNFGHGIQLLNNVLKQITLHLHGKIDCIAMMETRGFLIAPMLALHLNVPCVPVCKKKSLPGPVIELSYALEYGEDILALQINSIQKGQRILLVDDFLATGGTLKAASDLIKKMGGQIVEALVLMEKCELEGRKRLDFPVTCLISDL